MDEQRIDATPLQPIVDGMISRGALTKYDDYTRATDLEEIDEVLSSTIKEDRTTKLITFLCMLLTYTYEDQTNIAFQAESSAGKSYIPIELGWYFPDEGVRKYASTSPTAFFHEYGQWDPEGKAMIVNLERKILIFLDQPHYMLLEKLRSLLSHDDKTLTYKITDRSKSQGLRTKTVIIIGFPTVIFCSAKMEITDQERTRLFLLSPQTSEAKIRSALELTARKLGDRDSFNQLMAEDPRRIWLRERIRLMAHAGVRNVIIDDYDRILRTFLRRGHLKPRMQRDLPRLIGLIKAHALLNWLQRGRAENDCIRANEDDIRAGFELYGQIATSNELGLSPALWEFYEKVLVPQMGNGGLDRKDLRALYFKAFHRTISERTLAKELLPALESAGLISQDPDPADRRRMLISVFEGITNIGAAYVYGGEGPTQGIQNKEITGYTDPAGITYTDGATIFPSPLNNGRIEASGESASSTVPSQPSQPSLGLMADGPDRTDGTLEHPRDQSPPEEAIIEPSGEVASSRELSEPSEPSVTGGCTQTPGDIVIPSQPSSKGRLFYCPKRSCKFVTQRDLDAHVDWHQGGA